MVFLDESVIERKRRGVLVILLGGFFIFGLIFARIIPPFEGPDEAEHFAYIVWLAEGKGLPPRGAESWETPLQQESGQPPLYYAMASVLARLTGTDNPTAEFIENPYFLNISPRIPHDNDNRALHYPGQVLPLRGGWLAFYLARGLTLAFGLLLIFSVYRIALQLFPNTPSIALGAAFIIAFWPQVFFLSSVISNDIPAAALSSMSLWFLSILITGTRAQRGWLPAFAAGSALGLAGLTKINALLLLLPMTLGIIWLWFSGRRTWRQALVLMGFLGLGVGLMVGWWFAIGWLDGGSATGLAPHDNTPWAITDPATQLPSLGYRWYEVCRYFFIALGWGTIRPPSWVYNIAAVFSLLAVAGWVVQLNHWRKGINRPSSETAAMLAILAVAIIVLMIFLETWMHRVVAPYGRLLYPAISGFALFGVLGWRALNPRLTLLAYGGVLALTIAMPFWLIIPAYTPPPLVHDLPAELDVKFTEPGSPPFAELISVTPGKKSIVAGDVLAVRICWAVLSQPKKDYTVFLQLNGPGDQVTANRYTYPGQGLRPTSAWQPGESWCDQVYIQAGYAIDRTLVYRLQVGLLDDATDKRVEAINAAGAAISTNFVDDIRVVSLQPVNVESKIQAEGPSLQLLDHDLLRDWRPGTAYLLELTWGIARPVDRDYQLFIHLTDPQTGTIVFQADGSPLGGWYPTSWWEQGEVVEDNRLIPLPDDISPGTYSLEIGWYDLQTGERLEEPISLGNIFVR